GAPRDLSQRQQSNGPGRAGAEPVSAPVARDRDRQGSVQRGCRIRHADGSVVRRCHGARDHAGHLSERSRRSPGRVHSTLFARHWCGRAQVPMKSFLLQRRLSVLLLAAALTAGTVPGSVAAQQPTRSQARALTLAQALEIAERNSETVGIAREELARAQGDRKRAKSGYFPQVNGSAYYLRTLESQFSALETGTDTSTATPEICREFVPNPSLPVEQRLDSLESAVACSSSADPFAGFRNLPFGRVNTYRFGLSFSQTLFSGGQVSGQSRAASANARSAALGLTSAQAQLLLDVTGAYYDASLADRLLGIAEATLEQADTTLSQTRLARQVGNQSEFDLLRARVTRDNQRPVVIQRRADRDLAHYRLKQLLDFPLDQPLALATELGDTTLVDSPRLSQLVANPGDTSTS